MTAPEFEMLWLTYDSNNMQVIVHTDYNFLQVCDAKSLEPKRLITYATIDPSLAGFGICAHRSKDRKRGLSFNYLISEKGELSVFALNYKGKPASLVWKTVLPCPPCYIIPWLSLTNMLSSFAM